ETGRQGGGHPDLRGRRRPPTSNPARRSGASREERKTRPGAPAGFIVARGRGYRQSIAPNDQLPAVERSDATTVAFRPSGSHTIARSSIFWFASRWPGF